MKFDKWHETWKGWKMWHCWYSTFKHETNGRTKVSRNFFEMEICWHFISICKLKISFYSRQIVSHESRHSRTRHKSHQSRHSNDCRLLLDYRIICTRDGLNHANAPRKLLRWYFNIFLRFNDLQWYKKKNCIYSATKSVCLHQNKQRFESPEKLYNDSLHRQHQSIYARVVYRHFLLP